ncbi:MAG: AEC family transporter [Parasporobacterium sp.]|nr:AEC family transporter [Parasporobacterium sp.]
MSSFSFAINATLPLFILIAFGFFLRKVNVLNEGFLSVADKFNFKVTLPVLLFVDLSSADFIQTFDLKFVLFCAIVTSVVFWGTWGVAALLIKDPSKRGEVVQACYRSSAAVMGIALIANIYGTSSMSGLMILGCVPLYNIYAVILLQATSPNGTRGSMKKTLLALCKNPILIGVVLGILSSVIGIQYPELISKSLNYIARMASPLALICIGAEFNFNSAKSVLKYSLAAALVKLVVLPVVFVSVAILMGFRNEQLVAIFVMLAGATTPSAFVMARQYGNEGMITAGAVVITTLGSIFTLTLFVFLLKNFGFI